MTPVFWKACDKRIRSALDAVARAGTERRVPVYLVGGAVRDILLRNKNFDLDCVAEGHSAALAKDIAQALGGACAVHPRFGTATVLAPNGVRVDLAMAREEHYPRPGALPVVRPGTIRADLGRRDFTVNAMAAALNGPRAGELLDPFAGQEDLKRRWIRILHGKSFQDDPTRILRAVRYEQRLGFALEPQTRMLLRQAVTEGRLATVTRARYFADFRKILAEPAAAASSVRRLHALDALRPFFEAAPYSLVLLEKVERARARSKAGVYPPDLDWPLMRLMALIAPMAPEELQQCFSSLPLLREEKAALLHSLDSVTQSRGLMVKNLPAGRIYAILKPLARENIFFIRLRTSVKIVQDRVDRFWGKWRHVRLAVTGDDVRQIFGPAQAGQTGQILGDLLSLRLDGRYPTRVSQLKYLRTRKAGR